MDRFEIRAVALADARRLAEIYRHYVLNTTVSFETTPPTVSEMEGRIRSISGSCPFYVAVESGSEIVVGYCYAHPWKERPAYARTVESTIYLASEATGCGLGRSLMKRVVDDCRSLGYHAIIACVTAENETSCRFHQALGFEKVSHFKGVGFKFGRWLDVVDYELVL